MTPLQVGELDIYTALLYWEAALYETDQKGYVSWTLDVIQDRQMEQFNEQGLFEQMGEIPADDPVLADASTLMTFLSAKRGLNMKAVRTS